MEDGSVSVSIMRDNRGEIKLGGTPLVRSTGINKEYSNCSQFEQNYIRSPSATINPKQNNFRMEDLTEQEAFINHYYHQHINMSPDPANPTKRKKIDSLTDT